eukprot:Hpha_TRINITY_DN7450_c0_g1::TRINITY_DN7450_c0_g1_i1::g.95755::m.95755
MGKDGGDGAKGGDMGDIDKMMEQLGRPVNQRSKSPVKDRRLEVRDCLANESPAGVGVPSFSSRSPQRTDAKGWTLAGRTSSPKQFMGKGMVNQATASPGPIYQPRAFTEMSSRGTSFPKSRRAGAALGTAGPGPGGRHDVPSTLCGQDKTRSASPGCKFGTAERFRSNEFISPQHSRAAGSGASGPGPQQYDGSPSKKAPAFSFGPEFGSRVPATRFNSKAFISRMHAGAVGPRVGPAPGSHQADCSGKDPEGFARAYSSHSKRSPQWSIGAGYHEGRGQTPEPHTSSPSRVCSARFISSEHSKAEGPTEPTPGPGAYFKDDGTSSTKDDKGRGRQDDKDKEKEKLGTKATRALDAVRKKAPSYSFGVLTATAKMHAANAFAADARGRVSPGPCYFPKLDAVQKDGPAFSFADYDPDLAYWKERFEDVRYLGGGMGCQQGTDSPGPAGYVPYDPPRGPAYSMARKDRSNIKRISPSPDCTRFVGRELAKENYGAYSPGPKYNVAGILGSNAVSKSALGTFGLSDREWQQSVPQDVRDKAGTAVKPYTTPGEARYISKNHAEANFGRCSPGPVYMPEDSVVREKAPTIPHIPDGSMQQTSPQRTKHFVLSTQRSPPAVGIGSKSPTRWTEDTREHHPIHALTQKQSPCFVFGSAARNGTGPFAEPGKDLGKGKKGEQMELSPGPGSFTPNYLSVQSHTPGLSLGGLAEGYSVTAPRNPGRPQKAKKAES